MRHDVFLKFNMGHELFIEPTWDIGHLSDKGNLIFLDSTCDMATPVKGPKGGS